MSWQSGLRVMSIGWLALIGVVLSVPGQASDLSTYTFVSPKQEQDFRELVNELRCLVCQNESLLGSQAELAKDLRDEVYRILQEGHTKAEAIEFLVTRYGDFVLYDPPLKPSNYPLWFGPLILIFLATLLFLRTLFSQRKTPVVALSPEEEQHIQALLASPRTSASFSESTASSVAPSP
ncbi:MAG: cytochrome c-type biogenesis protein [Pseudomonadota bacterium]